MHSCSVTAPARQMLAFSQCAQVQVIWRKLELLARVNGLVTFAEQAASGTLNPDSKGPIQPSSSPSPDSASPSPVIPVPTTSPSPSPSPATNSTPPAPASPPPESPSPVPVPVPANSPAPIASPTPVPVDASPQPQEAPTSPGSGSAPCVYSLGRGGGTWLTDGVPTNNINLYLHASGADPIPSPYTVTVTNQIYTRVTEVWNYDVSQLA